MSALLALTGGLLIGLAAAALYLLNGRLAGISDVVGGVVAPRAGELGWRLLFVAGLVAGTLALAALRPDLYRMELVRSPAVLMAAGLLVGFGARLGNGCTSGHGVCGIGRLSPRSFVFVALIMIAGALAVQVSARALGGAS